MDSADDLAPPSGTVAAKRPGAKVPVVVDWHDYLANTRQPGQYVALDTRVRPPRAKATGAQYRCTAAGYTSGDPYDRVKWAPLSGAAFTDGGVTWTPEAMDTQSLRAMIVNNTWTFPSGINKSDEGNADFRYWAHAAGGSVDQDYELLHAVTLSNAPGELQIALIVLPVRD
jgi:hypothetical protein